MLFNNVNINLRISIQKHLTRFTFQKFSLNKNSPHWGYFYFLRFNSQIKKLPLMKTIGCRQNIP